MIVNEMLERMSSKEIIYWQAFYSLESKEDQGGRQQKTMINNLKGKRGRRVRK